MWTSTFLTDAADVRTHMVITGIDMSSAAESGGLFGHLVLAANATALISTDLKGRVTYCSTGAERMLGRDGSNTGRPHAAARALRHLRVPGTGRRARDPR